MRFLLFPFLAVVLVGVCFVCNAAEKTKLEKCIEQVMKDFLERNKKNDNDHLEESLECFKKCYAYCHWLREKAINKVLYDLEIKDCLEKEDIKERDDCMKEALDKKRKRDICANIEYSGAVDCPEDKRPNLDNSTSFIIDQPTTATNSPSQSSTSKTTQAPNNHQTTPTIKQHSSTFKVTSAIYQQNTTAQPTTSSLATNTSP